MKRVLLWGALLLCLVYSGLWFFASKIVEVESHRYLDRLKQTQDISEHSGNIYITGFPFAFNVNLAHPRIKFQKEDAHYNIKCDMLFDGILAVELGFFSNKIKLRPIGDLHLKGNLNRYQFDSTIGGKSSDYQIRLNHSLILSALKSVIGGEGKSKEDFALALIDSVIIRNEDLSVLNKLTNKLLVYAKKVNVRADVGMTQNLLNLRYREHLVDMEFDKEFSVLSSEMLKLPFVRALINKIDINVRNYFDVFSPDKLGKINHEIDLEIKRPGGAIALKINKLRLNDAIYDIDAKGSTDKETARKVNLIFSANFSDKWYDLMKIYANRLQLRKDEERLLATGNHSIFATIFNSVSGFIGNMLKEREKYASYVPNLHNMGTIQGDTSFQYKQIGKGFEVNITKFKLTADHFGIDATGEIENAGTGGGDKYQLKASLSNYSYILDSLVGYINRIAQNAGHTFFISGKKLTISQNVSTKIKSFIKEISDDPKSTSQDLKLTVMNKDGTTCPAIGKYNNKEFCSLWHSFVFDILLSHIVKALNPERILKDLPLTIEEDAGKIVKNVVGGIFGLFDKKKS